MKTRLQLLWSLKVLVQFCHNLLALMFLLKALLFGLVLEER